MISFVYLSVYSTALLRMDEKEYIIKVCTSCSTPDDTIPRDAFVNSDKGVSFVLRVFFKFCFRIHSFIHVSIYLLHHFAHCVLFHGRMYGK